MHAMLLWPRLEVPYLGHEQLNTLVVHVPLALEDSEVAA